MKRINPREALKQILNPTFTRVKSNQSTQTVSTKWLGYLVMESLRSYRDNPSNFGRDPRSFDAVIKKFVDDNIGSSTRARRPKNLKLLFAAYESPRGPRQRLAMKRVGRASAAKYLRLKGQGVFKNSVADMLVKNIGAQRVIPSSILLPEGTSVLQDNCRNIQADLDSIVCKQRSETSDDEIYLLTGAMLFDSTGKWKTVTNYMRNETKDINAPPDQEVDFPEYLNPLFNWNIAKPSESNQGFPVSTACSITLMEKDQSPRDQVYKSFQAAYYSARLLSNLLAGTAGGPVGIAIAIAGILILIVQALDGDDLLGTADFRFDNILATPAPRDFRVPKEVSGSQKGNSYRYILTVRYRCEDFDHHPDFSCHIDGKDYLKIDRGSFVKSKYKMLVSAIGDVQAQVDNIRWTVFPSGGVQIQDPTKRDTYIKFYHDGSFVVKVTARVVGTGVELSDSHRVGVDESNGNPTRRPRGQPK